MVFIRNTFYDKQPGKTACREENMSDENKNMEIDEDLMVEVVTFVDDEGNEFEMEIIEELEHKGKKYAVLAEFSEEEHEHKHEDGEECDCGEESLYIFEVVAGEEGEDFLSVDDDVLMGELSEKVEELLFNNEE